MTLNKESEERTMKIRESRYEKSKLGPRKGTCKDTCYGEQPCDFALAFDRLARKLDLNTVCTESLRTECDELKEKFRSNKIFENREDF